MPSEKRSISFDEQVLAEAERRVSSSGGNLSAFVNAAVLRELRVARGIELLAEDEAQFGAVPEDASSDQRLRAGVVDLAAAKREA